VHCTLCNEHIEEMELEFEEAFKIEDEYWHAECFAEYFEESEMLESV
jgi:hypothetical protein